MKRRERQRRWQNVGLAWLGAFLIVAAVFSYWHVSPFGTRSLLMSDMGTQYVPLLTALQHALRYHAFHLYSFSQSLGGNIVPTVAYYLLSPFNLVVLGFSAANVPTAASVIIMLKIATIAATMTWFLQRHFRTTQRMTIVFALGFSFCGFVAVNYFDLMWLDALIILPLVANGIDQLVATKRLAPFFWWLLASIVTNYYLGYMTCLFSLAYFGYVLANWSMNRQTKWHRAYWFAGTATLSGISGAFILIPTGLGMLQTAKGTANALNFKVVPEFGLEVFRQFGVGATNYGQRLMHAPTVFVSSAVILLVLTYFVSPRITRRQKGSAAALLTVLFLGMWVRLFNTIWHLMQAPAGFPFRNVFFFSFVLVMLGFAAWQAEPQRIARRWQWGLPAVEIVLMVLGVKLLPTMLRVVTGRSAKLTHYYAAIQQTHWSLLALASAYMVATAVVVFGTRRLWRKVLLTGLVATEVGGNFVLSMRTSQFGNQTAYARAYQIENRQMSQVNDPDGQLYRVQNDNTLINQAYSGTYHNYNDSLLFNFHGLAAYSSALNERTRQTLANLGMDSENVRRISAVGLTPLTEMLLGVKKTVHLTPSRAVTTQTVGYSGMGFAVSSALNDVTLGSDALRNQEEILQALAPTKQPYFAAAKIVSDQAHRVTAKTYVYRHVLKLRVTKSGWGYLWAPTGATKYTSLKLGTRSVAPTMNINGRTALIKLGKLKAGQVITLHFAAKYAVAAYKMQVATLRQAAFARAKQQIQQQSLKLHTTGSRWQTKLTGTVRGTASRNELYLSIPMDSGWQATVNGKRVNVTRVLGGLMAVVPLQSGSNQVTLTYHVPGGRLGVGLSAVSLVAFIGLDYRRKQWTKSRKTGKQHG